MPLPPSSGRKGRSEKCCLDVMRDDMRASDLTARDAEDCAKWQRKSKKADPAHRSERTECYRDLTLGWWCLLYDKFFLYLLTRRQSNYKTVKRKPFVATPKVMLHSHFAQKQQHKIAVRVHFKNSTFLSCDSTSRRSFVTLFV